MSEALVCPRCGSPEITYKKKAEQWECDDCETRFDAPSEARLRPQRIFLSYGHDDNTPLVLLLRERLEAAGHSIWIDQTHIRAGDDWRLAIKKGLLESDRVLSFLSKHSTRDPGVCLDEIGIALAHRHGAIATLLVEPVQQVKPPPSLSHIQYLDLSEWRHEREQGEPHWTAWVDAQAAILLDIIARNAGFAGEMDELQRLLTPHTQGGRLGTLVEREFVGRDWLFKDIEAWRHENSERTFWLVAEPGMGKSAIAARLAHIAARHTVAYHFCRFDEPDTRSPETFVRTLAFQLAARLPGYRTLLLYAARYPSKPLAEVQADDLFTLLLTSPLRYSIDGGQSEDRLLVLVDALDEAPAIADLLARRHGDLPSWVALLLTSRPDSLVQSALSSIAPHVLANDDPRNQSDLDAYLDQWLATVSPAPPTNARTALLKNSEGNILYLATAREGEKVGVFNLEDAEAYPKGLGALYRNWFDRKFGDGIEASAWSASYALLELVCASPEPLPITVARQTLDWVGQDRIKATRPLGSLVQQQDNAIEMFHRSLAEWLQDAVLSDRYWVNAEDGRIRLAKTLWGNLSEILKAATSGYAHRVLPGLLLATPANRRQEIWGTNEERFAQIDQLDEVLKKFQEHKVRLARLELARVLAEEFQGYYGEESEKSLDALSALAILLRDVTSAFAEAQAIQESVLATREKILGPEHLAVATSLNNLARLLHQQGDFVSARPLHERSLAIREKMLGSAHPDTAVSLNNLAGLLMDLGEYAAARSLYERSLAIFETVRGPDHPETANSLSNLARLLMVLGEYSAARSLYERSLAIFETVLGPDHPATVNSLSNLAGLLDILGEYETARPLYERSLVFREKVLGPDHPDTAISLSNLAGLLDTLGEYKDARPLFERALAICEKAFGLNHADTAGNLTGLAILLGNLGDYEAARPLHERSLAIREKVFGLDHPNTAIGLNNLAAAHDDLGEYEVARQLYERSLAICEKIFGLEHPTTATGLTNLAGLLNTLGEYKDARPLFERALAIREKVFGLDHPETASSFSNLARNLLELDEFNTARRLYERSLAIRERLLGSDHPLTTNDRNIVAILLEALGNRE
jgi:tetratricopeptide (TPR) repeat protein